MGATDRRATQTSDTSASAALEAEALALVDACDWHAAATAFERAAASEDGCAPERAARLWEMGAQAWQEGGDARAAAKAAEAATEAAPEWPEAWATLGRALRNAGGFAAAAAALRRAAQLLPAGADADSAAAEAAEAAELHELRHARALPLPSGAELRLLETAVPSCAHAAARERVVDNDRDDASGPACRVWEAGVVLARWLALGASAGAPALAGARVLELGAGTGVCGLAAAALGGRVTLSDRAAALHLLRRNAAANAHTLGGTADVACLDWAAPPAELADEAAWELILAADCVYSPAQVGPFVATVARLTAAARPGGMPRQLLLAHKDRDAAVTAALLAALRDTARLQLTEQPHEAHDAQFRTRSVRIFVGVPMPAAEKRVISDTMRLF